MQNVADIYALSPMQQLMLLHVKMSGTAQDILFSQIVYRLTGPLDSAAYRRAWEQLVERHAALRTLFVWQEGKDPVQVVRQQVLLPWTAHDWRGLSAAQQERQLDDFLRADRAQGIDLLHPPAMRLALLQLADQESWLVWSSHHLILDRWCIGIVFEELQAAYDAYLLGTVPLLPPAPRYRDYISWLADQDEAAARAYWHNMLNGISVQPLPLNDPEPGRTSAVDRLPTALAGEQFGRLRRFARDNGLTLGTLVNAAWALVLGSVTGGDEALFGLTMSGRPSDLPPAERAVGSFINNVPLRVQLPGDAPLLPWLHSLQESQLSLEPYQHYSPAQIQTWAGLRAAGPLFETLVVYQAPLQLAAPAALSVQQERGGMQTGYPLSLAVIPEETRLRFVLTYEVGRVPAELAEQMGTALLAALVALPDLSGRPLVAWRAAVPAQVAAHMPAAGSRRDGGGERPYLPPRTPQEQALARIWAELLDVSSPGIDDSFFALGGDSISALQLFALVEARLGQRLPVSLIFGDPTLAEMAGHLVRDLEPLHESPVVQPINPAGSLPPFFYMHGVYGDVSSLRNFGSLLEPQQPLYGLEAIGLRPGQEPDESIEAMAARCAAAIREVQPHGPYNLGGFCFGGVLAYEVARQLGEAGEHTAFLAIIEGSAPPALHQRRPIYDSGRLAIIRQAAPYWLSGNKELGGWRLRERLARLTGRPRSTKPRLQRDAELDNFADFDTARPESQLKLSEINKRAINAYVPRPYAGPVTLFRARAVHPGHVLRSKLDPLRGWGGLAGGGVTVRYVSGTHAGILEKPYASDLAAQLTAALREAQTAVSD